MRFDRHDWPVVNAVLDGNGSSSLYVKATRCFCVELWLLFNRTVDFRDAIRRMFVACF